jgi:uncharacterized UPF0160 family protein
MSLFSRRKIVITHNGSFHPDDFFAVATLLIKFGKLKVIRTRDENRFKSADFLVDVGSIYNPKDNRFDHHQKFGAGVRENGTPYASFGLVWKEYGESICNDKDVSKLIENRLVSYIDSLDNGVGELKEIVKDVLPYTIGMAIVAFNKTWKDRSDNYDNFIKAVNFAEGFLRREIVKTKDEVLGMNLVRSAYEKSEDKRLIFMDEK